MTPSKRSSNPIEPSNKAGSELGRRAAGAAAFLLGGVGAAQLIRLVGNVVLTRLLFPEAFGLMGQVVVFLIGLHLFSDIGIGPSIVQSARGDDPKYLNTAWAIQIGRGTVLWLAGLAVAYPFAAFYEKPNLAPLLLAASTTSLITGFQSTKINLAARNLNQRSLAKLDLTSQAAGLVVTVSCAYAYRSVWALVAGSLFADVVRVTLSHIVLPGPRNHFRYDSESARSLIRFGRWIFLSTVLTFLVSYSDRLIFPKLVDSARFGIYQTGANIAALAPAVLSVLANHILFPVYSRILQSGGNLRGVFSDVRRPLLIAGGWALSGLAAGGPAAVHLLYDAR
ncbi:MAG: oligosaccharide flippase family protein, partial [Polyangiaceae bacterium]|nr:oligosaccharide flippase family protein [Polyangiaceae bacterium]